MPHTEQDNLQVAEAPVTAEDFEKALADLEKAEQVTAPSLASALRATVDRIGTLLRNAHKAVVGDDEDEDKDKDEDEEDDVEQNEDIGDEEDEDLDEDNLEELLEELRRNRESDEEDEEEDESEEGQSPARKSFADHFADAHPEIVAADELVAALVTSFSKSLEARDQVLLRAVEDLANELRDLRKSLLRMTKGLEASAGPAGVRPADVPSPGYAERLFQAGASGGAPGGDIAAILEKAVLAGRLSPAEAHAMRRRHGTDEWSEVDAAKLQEVAKAIEQEQQ